MEMLRLEPVKTRLKLLGFDSGVDDKLLAEICFNPTAFDLRFERISGDDRCQFVVRVERLKEQYDVLYYIACLRKGIELSAASLEVGTRMEAVDWRLLSAYRNGLTDAIGVGLAENAWAVLRDAAKLPEYSLLLYKYWAGTPLEILVPGLPSLRATYEISQRFYVLEDDNSITGDEAMRFLLNRWRERRIQQKRAEGRKVFAEQPMQSAAKPGNKKSSRKK